MINQAELRAKLQADRQMEPADAQVIQAAAAVLVLIFAVDEDIHRHTVAIGREYTSILLPLDHKYAFSDNAKPLDETIDEIMQYCGDDAAVRVTLESIRGYGAGHEPETNVRLQDLLIRTWALANNPILGVDQKHVVTQSLKHNVLANGGCYAGVSARLVAPYTLLIELISERTHQIQTDPRDAAPAAATAEVFDEELRNALGQSRALAEAADLEQEELMRVLRISRDSSSPSRPDAQDAQFAAAQAQSLLEFEAQQLLTQVEERSRAELEDQQCLEVQRASLLSYEQSCKDESKRSKKEAEDTRRAEEDSRLGMPEPAPAPRPADPREAARNAALRRDAAARLSKSPL